MLTDIACRRAQPRAKPYKMADARGLYLEVLTSGTKSWRWKYRIGGKEKRLVFGVYPEISLQEAREAREVAARSLRQGIDPSVERLQRSAAQVAKMENTFMAVALGWHASQSAIWAPRHAASVKRSLETDVFPALGRLPIADVTTPLVLKVLRDVEHRGSADVAQRVRQRISDVFIRAIAGGIATSNPAADTGKALGRVRHGNYPAVTTIRAARELLQTVEAAPGYPLTKLASRLLALTAVRSGVLRVTEAHEFEDLDGTAPLWRIPAAKMKLGQEQRNDASFEFVVPLAHQAVEVVKTAIAFSGKDALLFRSIRMPRRPITDNTIGKAYREAGYAGVHVPHGWRSTFSTTMNRLAAEENRVGDRDIIELMLAHIDGSVAAIYNRYAYMPRRREIAQEWADMLSDGLVAPAQLLEGRRHR